MDGDGAVHEVVDEERASIRGEGEALRGAADIEAGDDLAIRSVDDGDGAAGFEGDEEVAAGGVEEGGAGHAGVVEVEAGGGVFDLGC